MGDHNGTCRAIEEFRHGADPILQDACDTHARVTRAKLIEVCRIPLELKAEIDKTLEHRRTRKPVLVQVLPNRASSGAAAVATVAVARPGRRRGWSARGPHRLGPHHPLMPRCPSARSSPSPMRA